MLLPTFLRKRFNTVRCGFFLHSPFPSSEVFRTFPNRDLVLRGLLNADVVASTPLTTRDTSCPVPRACLA